MIAGQKYVIKSDADEQYVNALARYVDDKIGELRRATRTVSTQQVAILAALNIADDFFREQQHGRALKSEVRERAQRALALLEQEVRRT